MSYLRLPRQLLTKIQHVSWCVWGRGEANSGERVRQEGPAWVSGFPAGSLTVWKDYS